jgi:tellurite resistance protein
VYQEFDLDGGGDVGDDELLVLGQTRRKLGQKEGSWTKGMNDTLMNKIGKDRNGNLPANNFVKYFDGSLAGVRAEFDKTIEQFMECARACRKTKIAKREADKQAKDTRARPSAARSVAPAAASASPHKAPSEPRSASRPANGSARNGPSSAVSSPSRVASPKLDRATSRRHAALRGVFRKFDLDRGGYVEAQELMVLGKARRTLGQKSGEWNEEKNTKLIKRMDTNGDGQISENEFIEFFSNALPLLPFEFETTVSQFLKVAESVKK